MKAFFKVDDGFFLFTALLTLVIYQNKSYFKSILGCDRFYF